MIVIQVLLGGITRLTGSGLSITEWKPIMGALPPMTDQDWNLAFEKYKQIAQFKYVNNHFELEDFQFIFFWEWFHRLWARVLGVVFAIGFVYFLLRRYFKKDMILPLIILFILGAAQGLIGWIMVASGLNETDVHVNHIKLAMHFMAALLLLCYTLWFALKLLIPANNRVGNRAFYNFTFFVIVVLCFQLVYGAFMAGLKAAMSAATWPTINGMWVPDSLATQSLTDHPINVHFMHRVLAYLLVVITISWFIKAGKVAKEHMSNLLQKAKWWPLVLIIFQLLLGVVTVLSAPKITFGKFGQFETLAELHQLVAMFFLMALLVNLYIVKPARK